MSDANRQGAGQHGQRALQGAGPTAADNTESEHQQPSLSEAQLMQAFHHHYPLSDRSMLSQPPFLVLPSEPLQGSSSLEGPGIHGGGGGGSGTGTVGMSPGGVMGLSSQHGQTLQGLRGQGAQLYGAQLGPGWQAPQSSLHQSDMISYYVPTFGSSGQGSGVPGGSGGGPGSGGGARSGGGGPGSPSGGSASGLGLPSLGGPSLGGLGFSPLPPVPVSGPPGPSPAEVTLRLFPEAGGRPGGGGIPQSPSPQSHLQQQQEASVGISCRSPGMGMAPAPSRASSAIPAHMGPGDRMGGESTPPASPGLQQLHVPFPMVRVGDPGAVAGGNSYNWSRVFDLPKYWPGEGNVGGEVIQGSVVEVPHGGGAMEGGGQMGAVGTSGPGMAPQGEVQTVQEMPKRRAKRGQATDPHSIAERIRRERISERLRKLHELLPISDKVDTATMLDEAIQYVRRLQGQVQELNAKRADAGGSSTAGGAPEGEAQGGGGVSGTSAGGEEGRGAGGTTDGTAKGPTTSESINTPPLPLQPP